MNRINQPEPDAIIKAHLKAKGQPYDRQEFEFNRLIRPVTKTLEMLVALHWFESAAQVVALTVFWHVMELELPYPSLIMIVGAFAVWNLASIGLIRLSNANNAEMLVAIQLTVEVLVLTALVYHTGGATNPFVSLYLIPIALASIMLRLPLAVAVAILAISCYSVMFKFYVPLLMQPMNHQDGFSLHVLGMWITFLIGACVSVVALSFLASLARSRAESIADLRERIFQDRQITILGGQSAAAAHSLSTPLSTVAIVLDGLLESQLPVNNLTRIQLARDQLDICRDRLSMMLDNNRAERLDTATVEPINQLLANIIIQWKLLHPEMVIQSSLLSSAEAVIDATLEYSLTTILDNAAEANLDQDRQQISLRSFLSDEDIIIEIEDEGGGPVPDFGNNSTSTKTYGAGVGLTIANANLQRLGGSLSFTMGDKGCIARVTLPGFRGK